MRSAMVTGPHTQPLRVEWAFSSCSIMRDV